jgi:hypothetical protein
MLLLAGPTYRGPARCKYTLWTIKRRVYSLEGAILAPHLGLHKDTPEHPSQVPSRLPQSIQHPSGRRVLRSGGPNHSKILVSFLCSSAHRSSAPRSPPNSSLTRIRRVHSATRLEISSDIFNDGKTYLVLAFKNLSSGNASCKLLKMKAYFLDYIWWLCLHHILIIDEKSCSSFFFKISQSIYFQ